MQKDLVSIYIIQSLCYVCRGKKSVGLALLAGKRSSSQPVDPKKEQQDRAAVAKKIGGQIPEKDSTPVVAVSDVLSEEAVEKKSEAIIAELCSSNDFQVSKSYVYFGASLGWPIITVVH